MANAGAVAAVAGGTLLIQRGHEINESVRKVTIDEEMPLIFLLILLFIGIMIVLIAKLILSRKKEAV